MQRLQKSLAFEKSSCGGPGVFGTTKDAGGKPQAKGKKGFSTLDLFSQT